jgi:tetratricopeptide (TPR) repeat protein
MPRAVNINHLDEFTLLRFAARDMNDIERVHAKRHLATCSACQEELVLMERLDGLLSDLGPDLLKPVQEEELSSQDPFFARPLASHRPGIRLDPVSCLEAVRRSDAVRERVLNAARASDWATEVEGVLRTLDLSLLENRYGLGFALDEARQYMAEGVLRWLGLALQASSRLEHEGPGPPTGAYAYPLDDLRARARLLSGFARLWTGNYEESGQDLRQAYRLYGQGTAAESSFARVEIFESQRRSFLDVPQEALILAERACATFEFLGLEEDLARSRFAKGLALSGLKREEEAIAEFRATLPVFAKAGLWNMYASTVSNVAASLLLIGRLDEARREYARALRMVSDTERPAILSFLRFNLGLLLLEGEKFDEAASAFAAASALFMRQGSRTDALAAELYQIESLARGGSTKAAGLLLEKLRTGTEPDDALDQGLLDAMEQALSGSSRDVLQLTVLREQLESILRERAARR